MLHRLHRSSSRAHRMSSLRLTSLTMSTQFSLQDMYSVYIPCFQFRSFKSSRKCGLRDLGAGFFFQLVKRRHLMNLASRYGMTSSKAGWHFSVVSEPGAESDQGKEKDQKKT